MANTTINRIATPEELHDTAMILGMDPNSSQAQITNQVTDWVFSQIENYADKHYSQPLDLFTDNPNEAYRTVGPDYKPADHIRRSRERVPSRLNLEIYHPKLGFGTLLYLKDGHVRGLGIDDVIESEAVCAFLWKKRNGQNYPITQTFKLDQIYWINDSLTLAERLQSELDALREMQIAQAEAPQLPNLDQGIWLDYRLGRVVILAKANDQQGNEMWQVGTEKETALTPLVADGAVKFDVSMDEFGVHQRANYGAMKTCWRYPCELIHMDMVRPEFFKLKNQKRYVAYDKNRGVGVGRTSFVMHGLDEFVYVLKDLPRVPIIDHTTGQQVKRMSRGKNPQLVDAYYTPQVVVLGETTGNIFVTPAFWLMTWTGSGKSAKIEQYQWHDPNTGATERAPSVFTYDPQVETLDYYADAADAAVSYVVDAKLADEPVATVVEIKTASVPKVPAFEAVMAMVNKKAPYWQVEMVTAAKLGLSNLTCKFVKLTNYQVGDVIAKVSLVHNATNACYTYEAYLKSAGVIAIRGARMCSQVAQDMLCRFVSYKAAEQIIMARQSK